MAENSKVTRPGYRTHYNISPNLEAHNRLDKNENPTGGEVVLYIDTPVSNYPALTVQWQDGPRGTGETNADGSPILAPPNGAFIEDVLWAALQRLEFFNESKYRDRANSLAITHIEAALQVLKDRQLERSYRNVEGKHEV